MKVFYFTSTGNNLHISKKLSDEIYSIPQLLKKREFEFEDESIGFVFPCYAFGTPRIVKEFLSKVKIKSSYTFAIMSYGKISGGALNQFHKLAEKAGIELSYINEIVMVDNYLPFFDMEKQIKSKPNEIIEKNIDRIIEEIRSKKQYIKKKNFLWSTATSIIDVLAKINYGKGDKHFTVEDTCDRCKVCEKVCPVDNIRLEVKPVYMHHCDECLGCTHHCPQNAIRDSREKSKARFINPNIKLEEIMDANN